MGIFKEETHAVCPLHKNLESELCKQELGVGTKKSASQTPIRSLSLLDSDDLRQNIDLPRLQFPYPRGSKAKLIASHPFRG